MNESPSCPAPLGARKTDLTARSTRIVANHTTQRPPHSAVPHYEGRSPKDDSAHGLVKVHPVIFQSRHTYANRSIIRHFWFSFRRMQVNSIINHVWSVRLRPTRLCHVARAVRGFGHTPCTCRYPLSSRGTRRVHTGHGHTDIGGAGTLVLQLSASTSCHTTHVSVCVYPHAAETRKREPLTKRTAVPPRTHERPNVLIACGVRTPGAPSDV